MDRVALLFRAAEVRRRIFASLPEHERLSSVLSAIAEETGYIGPWGKALGAELLRLGVQGMPDPGPRWNPKSPHPELTLPNGYMAKFMGDVYRLLLKKYRNPGLVSEAIDEYIAAVHAGKAKIDGSMPLESIESYLKQGFVYAASGLARQYLRQKAREESLESYDDEGGGESETRDIDDPQSLVDFERLLSRRMLNEWMAYLAQHTHPDMPLYLKLRMEGYTNDEIVGAPKKGIMDTMLPHYKAQGHPLPSDPSYWGDKYFKKFCPLTREFFKSKGEESVAPDCEKLKREL